MTVLASFLLAAGGHSRTHGAPDSDSLRVLHTTREAVLVVNDDNRKNEQWWFVSPAIRPDICKTSARRVMFKSDVDSLVIDVEKGMSYDFVILLGNDSAYTRVKWISDNPLEEPSEEMTKVAASGKLTRQQAMFDMDALLYIFGEVHPDMFSICPQGRLLSMAHDIKQALPDSITRPELFMRLSKLVAAIGDGHSSLQFPFNEVFTEETLRLPMKVDIDTEHMTMSCAGCIDGTVPTGADILSVNGIPTHQLLETMMEYASGERYFFRLERVRTMFSALFEMLYKADSYEVAYRTAGSKKELRCVLPALAFQEIRDRMPKDQSAQGASDTPYSFTIDSKRKTAVMDFRSFDDPKKMTAFADSMFTVLRQQDIRHLIIDLRNNGGGNSAVGDELLRYLSPRPFRQFGKSLVRISPLTRRLLNTDQTAPGWYWFDSDDMVVPRTAAEGHFDGKVYLLVSHHTFSSASSFAWAFQYFGMGTTIGEETGGMNVSYGDLVRYRLPVSRLWCSISFKRFWLYGADETDIHGMIPEYRTDSRDALEKAYQLIGAQGKLFN